MSAKKVATKATHKPKATPAPAVVIGYKGFDSQLRCRNMQYQVGKTYVHDGAVEACKAGFHACEYPLDVFAYYAPHPSRFAVVEQSGALSRHAADSKIASATITVKAEMGLHELIQSAVKWVFDHAKPAKSAHTKATRGAASSTGAQGAASSTGYQGAAMASGYAGRVMGADGNALFLVERDGDYTILAAWAGIVGRDGIKPHVWYTLKNGTPVELAP
ncbi:MAG: DUF7666 domain-containing protein [Acidobacteriaceae bacterium]